ncbi:MAG: hypothetical protein QXZ14_12060 [Candidatus Jordarchaeales archaeon]
MSFFTIEEAINVLSQKFLLQEGIAGVSCGSQKLRIYVENAETARKIPSTLLTYPVEVVVSGKFRTLSLPPAKTGQTLTGILANRTMKLRPVPGGVSVGSPQVTAGTLAGRFYDNKTGLKCFLSNRHVFYGDRGTPILQPGPMDGGKVGRDVIGYIERWAPLKPPPEVNQADAAIATPISQDMVSDEVLDIGVLAGVEEPVVGMRIAKSGRSCGYSTATVIDTSATVKVSGYPEGELIFENCVITTFCGIAGDSGSIAVNVETGNAVALLFAGSDVLTVFNPITTVCQLLDVSLPRIAAARAPPPITPMLAIPAGLTLFVSTT